MNAYAIRLLDVLRRRRALSAEDVALLLEQLPAALAGGAHTNPLLLQSLELRTDEAINEGDLRTPLIKWPDFALHVVVSDDPSMGSVTQVLPSICYSGAPLVEIGVLIYELLGGSPYALRQGRIPPLPGIGEEPNAMLAAVLNGNAPDPNLETFCRKLREALMAGRSSVRSEARKPPSLRSFAPTILTLRAEGEIPIRLVARREFRLGRGEDAADFVTRFSADRPDAEKWNGRLSRQHVEAALVDGVPQLRDGHAGKASANGSAFRGTALSPEAWTPIERSGELTLGSRYRLKLTRTSGAVFFTPGEGCATECDAVWLFSEAGFRLGSGLKLTWRPRGEGPAPALFLHDGKAFSVKNHAIPPRYLMLNGKPLLPERPETLNAGARLVVGEVAYTVEVK